MEDVHNPCGFLGAVVDGGQFSAAERGGGGGSVQIDALIPRQVSTPLQLLHSLNRSKATPQRTKSAREDDGWRRARGRRRRWLGKEGQGKGGTTTIPNLRNGTATLPTNERAAGTRDPVSIHAVDTVF